MTSRKAPVNRRPRAPRPRRGGTNFWDFLIFILSMGLIAGRERRERRRAGQGKPGLPKPKPRQSKGGGAGGGGGSPTAPSGSGGGNSSKGDRQGVYDPFDPAAGEEDAEIIDDTDDEDVSIDDDEPDDDIIDGEVIDDEPNAIESGSGGNDQ